MRKYNFSAIKEHVSTQYGDMTGVIQIDGYDNVTSIYALCEDHKFDVSEKFIIGFGLNDSSLFKFGNRNDVSCTILYVNKSEYGSTYDEIEQKVKQKKVLKVQKKNIYVNYSSLSKYIKRFDFMVTSELSKYAETIEIDE